MRERRLFPGVVLVLLCGHRIYYIFEGDEPDPWSKFDRNLYPEMYCVRRQCRRFGIRKHPVARVLPAKEMEWDRD